MTSYYQASPETLTQVAALVVQERPEWDAALVRIILASHAAQVAGTDLAIAALRAAQDRNLPTPKAIGWRGPHWHGLETAPVEVTGGPRCTTCGKIEPRCWSERPGRDDDHQFEAAS
jgi:hypothetical protein